MIDTLLQRAHQLVETGRYNEAEKELRHVLSQDPNHSSALALFAICRSELGFHDEAIATMNTAMGSEPDNDYFLYLLSLFHYRKNKLGEAEKFIRNAIAFNPNSADYFGMLANIKLQQKNWNDALQYANEGLEKDPENLICLNTRSTALFKLDKKDEAHETIREALNHDPHSDLTHTNLGWGLLEKGDHRKALEHFREALKINPENQYAKAGLVEGLKARYWFYRMFLKYAFWIGNMQAKGQWIVIIGLYFGIKLLNGLAESNKDLAVFIKPIVYLYTVFAISTWIIAPLSNLFLRLNVYGRYALTKEETQSSNFVGVSLGIAVIGGIIMLFDPGITYFMLMIFGLTMMIPLASMFNPEKNLNKKLLVGYTIALFAIGVLEIMQSVKTNETTILSAIYIFGVVAYQWIANALTIR